MSEQTPWDQRLDYAYVVHTKSELKEMLLGRGLASHLDQMTERSGRWGSPQSTELRALRGPESAFSDGLRLSGSYWPTPIVGSGLVAVSDQAIEELQMRIACLPGATQHLPQELKEKVPDTLADGTSLQTVTTSFLLGMARDRFGHINVQEALRADESPSPDDESSICALIAALAALLTECFQRAQGIMQAPVWGERDDVAAMEKLPPLDKAELDARFLSPAARILWVLDRLEVQSPLTTLLNELRLSVANGTLASRNLQRLTEYLWWKLTDDLTGYSPGWKDLMFSLSIQAGFLPVNKRESARPFIQSAEDIENTIRSTFRNALQSHWNDPSEYHDAVARLLMSLVRFRNRWTYTLTNINPDTPPYPEVRGDLTSTGILEKPKPMQADWPIASAFSVSFDLELEKALWKAGQRFAVLIPVVATYVYDCEEAGGPTSNQSFRHWTWLGRVVDPRLDLSLEAAEEIDCITQTGSGSDWFAVGKDRNFDPTLAKQDQALGFDAPKWQCEAAGLPVVVRATGCPAYQLPPPASRSEGEVTQISPGPDVHQGWTPYHEAVLDLQRDHGSTTSWTATWAHDVLVDDFSVSRRVGAESSWKTNHELVSSSLPSRISDSTTMEDEVRRTWLAAGLPLGDSAVRARVASLVAGPGPERGTGILVNDSIGVAECDLLSWYRFEFYCAEAKDFAIGLQQVQEEFNGHA